MISVGNLAWAAAGRRRVVARMAELLRDAGLPVAILSRGYGGSFAGDALVVSDGALGPGRRRPRRATSR